MFRVYYYYTLYRSTQNSYFQKKLATLSLFSHLLLPFAFSLDLDRAARSLCSDVIGKQRVLSVAATSQNVPDGCVEVLRGNIIQAEYDI